MDLRGRALSGGLEPGRYGKKIIKPRDVIPGHFQQLLTVLRPENRVSEEVS